MRGWDRQGLTAAVRAAGGEIFAVTSEPQALADEARDTWELDFEVVGDPHHEVAEEVRARGWLDLYVNREIAWHHTHAAWARHPKGYYQPGVLAASREGRVLYRWRSKPTRRNLGGAVRRPEATSIWRRVRAALQDPPGSPDAPPDRDRDEFVIPWPVYVLLMLADGHFIRPRGFSLRRGGADRLERRVGAAFLKLLAFGAAWAVAFVVLPAGWVLAALALYCAAITPRIREVSRAFQNEA